MISFTIFALAFAKVLPRCSPNPFSINDLWLQCIGTQCKLSDGVMEARRAGQIEDADILFNIFRFITIFLCSIKSVIGVVGRLQPPLFIGRVRVLCENKNDRPPPRWKLGWDREKVDLLPLISSRKAADICEQLGSTGRGPTEIGA